MTYKTPVYSFLNLLTFIVSNCISYNIISRDQNLVTFSFFFFLIRFKRCFPNKNMAFIGLLNHFQLFYWKNVKLNIFPQTIYVDLLIQHSKIKFSYSKLFYFTKCIIKRYIIKADSKCCLIKHTYIGILKFKPHLPLKRFQKCFIFTTLYCCFIWNSYEFYVGIKLLFRKKCFLVS